MGAMTTHAPIATHAVRLSSLGGVETMCHPPAGQSQVTSATRTPTTAAHATACATNSGRAAASAASARACICARHQTWPADGTFASATIAAWSVFSSWLTIAESEQVRHVVTWAFSSSGA